ncbi:MAG: redoxin domain-containing protein [Caldithrix sp.]|nr:redoxin domain-containing protein [Caldithrix sp.]
MKYLKWIIGISAVVFVLLIASFFIIQHAQQSVGEDLPKLYEVPEFTFMQQNGTTFSKAELLGKVNVVDFIFTNCKGPCPMMSTRMAEMYEAFASSNNVQFVSISVDPARDSLETLQEYASRFNVNDNRWAFLRTQKPEVVDLYENGFKLGGELPYEHSTKFILVDREGVIRGYYDSDDKIGLKHLSEHVKALLKG